MIEPAIDYADEASGLRPGDLDDLFEGWNPRPSPDERLAILRSAQMVVLARDAERLVGFATAISDGARWAYVTLLEVLPEYRERGIGSELMRRMIERCRGLYGMDLNCNDELVPFYERLGMTRPSGMVIRNRARLAEEAE